MLDRIIAFSIRQKLIVGLLVLGLIGWGAYNTARLPIDAVPDITNNQVQVITVSPALGAGDIERLVTFPVEQATRNIPGIIEQRSFSRFGLSVVIIFLYYALMTMSNAIGRSGTITPMFAVWIPNIVGLICGLYFIRKASR